MNVSAEDGGVNKVRGYVAASPYSTHLSWLPRFPRRNYSRCLNGSTMARRTYVEHDIMKDETSETSRKIYEHGLAPFRFVIYRKSTFVVLVRCYLPSYRKTRSVLRKTETFLACSRLSRETPQCAPLLQSTDKQDDRE